MSNPPSGHYRTILKDTHPNVRIAISNIPMSNVTPIPADEILAVLDASEDSWARTYAERIRNKIYTVIVENHFSDRYFRPGELYFKS